MTEAPGLTPEIFKQRVPCDDCPFRREGGVRHNPKLLLEYISYFTPGSPYTFPCHKSVPKTDTREQWSPWQDGQVVCAGGLIFAAKQPMASNLILYGISRGWYDPAQHTAEEKALVFDNAEEMLR